MKKKLGLYNPYLDVLGGGEKHILSILKALEDKYQIIIYWDENLTNKFINKFNLNFTNPIEFKKNVFKKGNVTNKLDELRNIDMFFYVTDGSYFFSNAKRNYIFSMYPQRNLYQMSLINRIKTFNYRFISNSHYTHNWLNRWGIKNTILYPYIDDVFLNNKGVKKEKIILSVGRFYRHLHSKQHETTIQFFKNLKRSVPKLNEYKLILIGSVKKEDEPYFAYLNKFAKSDRSIKLKKNVSFNELVSYYQKSSIYLHMAGHGIDDEKQPQQVEHLGIAPLEAMASGNIVFCYNIGGPKELITDGSNGYLFLNQTELISKINNVLGNQTLQKTIINNADSFIKQQFSYEVFVKNVQSIINS